MKTETTSPEAASSAGRVLKDETASPDAKRAAASALSQAPDHRAPALTKVRLAKDHQHAGVPYKAGEEIEVNEADEKWLRKNQVI